MGRSVLVASVQQPNPARRSLDGEAELRGAGCYGESRRRPAGGELRACFDRARLARATRGALFLVEPILPSVEHLEVKLDSDQQAVLDLIYRTLCSERDWPSYAYLNSTVYQDLSLELDKV